MNPSDQARQIGVVDSWLAQYFANDEHLNPGAATTLADTGALAAGYYDVFLSVTTNCALAAGVLSCEWRNAANNATIIFFALTAATQLCWVNVLRGVKVAANERFRFFSTGGFTGTVGSAIIAIRRA